MCWWSRNCLYNVTGMMRHWKTGEWKQRRYSRRNIMKAWSKEQKVKRYRVQYKFDNKMHTVQSPAFICPSTKLMIHVSKRHQKFLMICVLKTARPSHWSPCTCTCKLRLICLHWQISLMLLRRLLLTLTKTTWRYQPMRKESRYSVDHPFKQFRLIMFHMCCELIPIILNFLENYGHKFFYAP